MRHTGFRVGALVSAAALTLSPTAGAQAQQAQPGSGPPPPTEAEIAASPAAKRLKEVLELVNRGDAAAIQAYVRANGVDATKPPPWSAALPLAGQVLDLHRRSRGLELVRVAKVGDGVAIAVVRNKLTGDAQALAVEIEPQAPHRITGLPNVGLGCPSASATSDSVAQSEEAQLQKIGDYLKSLADADIFSGVVVIARDGKPVFSKAYGYADREKKIANTIDTPFDLASTNKLFTGLAIGQLVEQGKISYEDPLSKFIPDYPDGESAKRIKIKHLLSHTSGLGGYFNEAYFNALDRMRSAKAALETGKREPLKFEPGTKWAYSNAGYQLLGRIIEIASGEDYYDYLRKNLFAPAGMTNTSFPHFDRDNVAMAQRYDLEFDGSGLRYVNQAFRTPPRGTPDGGGIASAPDLLKLANALRAGRIVKPETFRLHASPKPELASPTYGYGFTMTARTGEPLVGHPGNWPGVCTDFGTLSGTPYTIVVLSNSTASTCVPVTKKVLQVLAPPKVPAA